MGFFDFLFGKKKQPAIITTQKVQLDSNTPKNFIAIDFETTGLSNETDRIIEIGAVKFIDGKIADTYGTLVNTGVHISSDASKVNHITDQMVKSNGISPQQAYARLTQFLGNNPLLVAHNARFDVGFLERELRRYGHSASINYLDTLELSKKLVKDLPDYKQKTVAKYFKIKNKDEHRAVSDAEVCGQIFVELRKIYDNAEAIKAEKAALSQEEKEVAAIILNMFDDISGITFYKNSSKCIDFVCGEIFLKFKLGAKGSYVVLPKVNARNITTLKVEDSPKSEGEQNVRVYFNNPFELESIADVLNNTYRNFTNYNVNNIDNNVYSQRYMAKAKTSELGDIDALIESARKRWGN